MATCNIDNERSESALQIKRRKKHCSQFYMANRTWRHNDQGYSINFGPQGDGNCQFAEVVWYNKTRN